MNRTAFKGGPGYLVFDGLTLQMEDETWKLTVSDETVDRSTNLHGKVGAQKDYSLGKLTFTPIGTTANFASLFTKLFGFFQPTNIGALLFPGTDKPAVINLRDGTIITLAAAAVTKPPTLTFSPTKNLFGEVELTCLIANNSAGTTAGDFVAVTTGTYAEPTFDPLTMLAVLYGCAWGSTSPFNAIEAGPDGITFEVTPSLEEKTTNNGGLLNYRLAGVDATAKVLPVNIDASDFFSTLMPLDGTGAARGKLASTRGQQLTVAGAATGDPKLTIASAVPIDPVDVQVGKEDRIGEVTFQAHRKFPSATYPLFTLGTV